MDISFFLAKYLHFRFKFSKNIELYIVDQAHDLSFDVIIRDDGKAIADDDLVESSSIISMLNLQAPHVYHQYFHKGMNQLQIEFKISQIFKPELANFHSLLGMIILEYPDQTLHFSYMSPKGEYLLDSNTIHQNFSKDELQSKELLQYLNELLSEHFEAVRYTI